MGKVLVGLGLVVAIALFASGLVGDGSEAGSMDPEAASASSAAAVTERADGEPAPTASTAPPTTLTALEAAEATGGFLAVRAGDEPVAVYENVLEDATAAQEPLHVFAPQDEHGIVRTFLVADETVDPAGERWYLVYLPVRPNGSQGWVRADQIETVPLTHHVRVSLAAHRLDLYEGDQKVASYPVGVGKAGTLTPTGLYYVTEKMRPPDPDGVYGELAIGISAFSENLTDWPGGGQVGIHGTNDDATIGTDVSHGCVRLHNEDILELTHSMPLGTPVYIDE